MTKKAMFMLLGLLCLSVAFLIASGADVDIGTKSKCLGIASLPHWLDADCKPALVIRLFFISLGLIPAIVLWYFAQKAGVEERVHRHVVRGAGLNRYYCSRPGCSFETRNPSAAQAHRSLRGDVQFHDVWVDEDTQDTKKYWCRDCPYETTDERAAREHRNAIKGASPTRQAGSASTITFGFDGVSSTLADTSTPTGFRFCPDCAEEVRAAARKCRFCGYMFDAVHTVSPQAWGPGGIQEHAVEGFAGK